MCQRNANHLIGRKAQSSKSSERAATDETIIPDDSIQTALILRAYLQTNTTQPYRLATILLTLHSPIGAS